MLKTILIIIGEYFREIKHFERNVNILAKKLENFRLNFSKKF